MMNNYGKRAVMAVAVAGALFAGGVSAAPIEMRGDFLLTQISDDGTLGDGYTRPGLVHDPLGTGTFDTINGDYLAPGTPFEGFGISANEFTTVVGNKNSWGGGSVGSGDGVTQVGALVDSSAGTANQVTWNGTATNGFFDISHTFFFNDGDENISIETRITALLNMTSLAFSRAIDPDPDNRSGGTASTNNERGLDLNADGDYDDEGEQSLGDFVSAEGGVTGLAMAMFTDSSYSNNSGIVTSCCSIIDPSRYLSGGDFGPAAGFDSVGDHGIGLGFSIGALTAGDMATITYAYVFGDVISDVDIPDDPNGPTGTVPAPATLYLMGLGLLGLGYRRSKKA